MPFTETILRERWVEFIAASQDRICKELEQLDGKAVFAEDRWERAEENGGGGRTRVMADGNVFEKAGVNTSAVQGAVTEAMRRQLNITGDQWFACGLSLVLHPLNPYVPTVHANWRYFELYNKEGRKIDSWFGGGTDLTPYYLFEEDATHFHSVLKKANGERYATHKKNCDDYFCNTHRNNERRGIGGVFYDYLRPANEEEAEALFLFQQANARAFSDAYLPVVNKRMSHAFGTREKDWQEIRRGRYVEFNLLHDRGTLFGLKTNGRTESILMSLPPRARWEYAYEPAPGSPEAGLLQACLHPKDWA